MVSLFYNKVPLAVAYGRAFLESSRLEEKDSLSSNVLNASAAIVRIDANIWHDLRNPERVLRRECTGGQWLRLDRYGYAQKTMA